METKLSKLSASPEADQALDRMLVLLNDGFTAGRITKCNLLTWLVLDFEKTRYQDCVDQIRRDHFDEVAYLESVVRQAKKARQDGTSSVDLSSLLAPVMRPRMPEKTRRKIMDAGAAKISS